MSDYNLETFKTYPRSALEMNSIPCVVGFIPKGAKFEESCFDDSDDATTDNGSSCINIEDTDSDDASENDPCLPGGDNAEARIFGRGVTPLMLKRGGNRRTLCCRNFYVASVILLSFIAIGSAIYNSWN